MEMAVEKANSMSAPKRKYQTKPAMTAMVMTAGTKMPAILSAILEIGALLELASSTSWMIWLMVVSAPTRRAVMWIKPVLLSVADVTGSPACFSTGMLSPVMAASSMLVVPSLMTPSAGILSPGRTTISSPTTSSSTGTTVSTPSRRTVACFGAKSMSFSMAVLVLPLARASRYLPISMSVTIIPADSKYKFVLYVATRAQSPWPMPQLMRKMAKTP